MNVDELVSGGLGVQRGRGGSETVGAPSHSSRLLPTNRSKKLVRVIRIDPSIISYRPAKRTAGVYLSLLSAVGELDRSGMQVISVGLMLSRGGLSDKRWRGGTGWRVP